MTIPAETLREIKKEIETATIAQARAEAAQTRAKLLTLNALVEVGAPLTAQICASCGAVGRQGEACNDCN